MTNVKRKFTGRDWVLATLFFVAAIAVYAPFRSRMAYHWDSAEFTLAINDYDVALSQPHAPGYFLYVMLGRLVNWFVGDAHASLVWVSVVAGAGVAAAMYLLGTAMFGRRTGIAAGLFAMTSPQIWFHSCVALTYVVDDSLVCVTVLVCWRVMSRGGSWGGAVGIGVLIALVGGVRQQTVITLAPLILFTFWNFQGARVAKLAVASGVALLLGLAWFVPMIKLSGGLSTYLGIVKRHSRHNAPLTVVGGGWEAVLENAILTAVYCANGLMLGLAVLLGALLHRVRMGTERKQAWDREHARQLLMLAAWIAPGLLLSVVGPTRYPGHVLTYMPGLLLLAAVVATQIKKPSVFVAVTATVCLVNMLAFLAWPKSWDGVFWGMGRTAREIRQHDAQVKRVAELIRTTYKPSEAFLCHVGESFYLGMRLFQLYLPEFEEYEMVIDPSMLTPPGKPMLSVRGGRLAFVRGVVWDGKRVALLIVPPGDKLDVFESYADLTGAREVDGSSGMVYELAVKAGRFRESAGLSEDGLSSRAKQP